jgi:hypothetical protein
MLSQKNNFMFFSFGNCRKDQVLQKLATNVE